MRAERAGGSASGRGNHSSHSSNRGRGDDVEDQSPFPPVIVERKEPNEEQEEQVRVEVSMVCWGPWQSC